MPPKKLKLGLIGCGTIGMGIAERLSSKLSSKVRLSFVADLDKAKADRLNKKCRVRARYVSLEELIVRSDIIIEAASAHISGMVVERGLRANKKVLIMSIGGLLHCKGLPALLKKTKGELILPSGALAGLDAVQSARSSKITRVTLTTSKPIQGLKGAPYFEQNGIDIGAIKKPTVVFEGTAKQAITHFPKNINVAVLLSFATLGPTKVTVKIITSPTFKKNSHHLEVEGAFGKITTTTDNVPSPGNPKTSYLAVLSGYATLEKMLSSFKIGT